MNSLILYLLFVFGGVGIESLIIFLYYHAKKRNLYTKTFSPIRYLFLISIPLIGTAYLIYLEGSTLLTIFLTFSILGPIFEWLVGFSYRNIVGERLWIYERLSFLGHTSLLTTPLWGMAGVLSYLINQQIK